MPFRLCLFLIASLLLAACSSTKVQEGRYSGKQPKYAISVDKEGRKHGEEIWWHPNGQVKYRATNKVGVREGRFAAWYSDGKPWYEGWERHGKPESTLTYWYPDGHMKSRTLYRDGIQLEREDWDASGALVSPRPPPEPPPEPAAQAVEAANGRQEALRVWAMRVRRTVESYWRVPESLAKEKPHEAVARVKVDRTGRILQVTWPRTSASATFNNLARQTFRKVKRLPPFPAEVEEESLDIQYEFVSRGKAVPRRRLEALSPEPEAPGEASALD